MPNSWSRQRSCAARSVTSTLSLVPGADMMTLPALFLLTAAQASEPSAEEAMAELQSVIEHIAKVEAAKVAHPVKMEQAQPAQKMADICYISLPDGKIQLEHCKLPADSVAVIGSPVQGDLVAALAVAPEQYKSLNPASVLPCVLARTAALWTVTPEVVALND